MKKITFLFVITLVLTLAGIACKQKKRKENFSHSPLGYYYQLISFYSDSSPYQEHKIAWLSLTFKNQADSVFWDSFNNLNDKFYMELDSSQAMNFLKNYVSKCAALDSACVLVRTDDFYFQQFKTRAIPFFSKNDSVVKINFKVKKIFSEKEFVGIKQDLRNREMQLIEDFYGSAAKCEMALDPMGFYWISKPRENDRSFIVPGEMVTIRYQGFYLNGRFLEKSPGKFEFIFGTPDQLLKGLNYVIGRLKLGENAKIILPSRLAFGENGSSNGIVPPYSPLIYEIEIIGYK